MSAAVSLRTKPMSIVRVQSLGALAGSLARTQDGTRAVVAECVGEVAGRVMVTRSEGSGWVSEGIAAAVMWGTREARRIRRCILLV